MVERQARRALVGELVDLEEIASSYLDVWGKEKRIDDDVRAALAKAMGPVRKPRKLAVEAGPCYRPEVLEQRRLWGFMVQLYGVRSGRNWGIGDFTDLRTLAEIAAGLGAGVIGVNPLHATQGSPYSPSSRHALNVLYIDVEAVPGFQKSDQLRRRLRALRDSELVDYEGVRAAKLEALEGVFRKTRPKVHLPSRGLRDFAVFEALREKFGGGWQSWPSEYQDPHSSAVSKFRKKHAKRVAFHGWLQATARAQLQQVQRRTQELGMPLGLYVDLALGADRGGAELWSDQEAFAVNASCGAPPDEFNPRGQDWGLPPYSPRALRAKGYQPFIDLLRDNMPVGGALRMDHVMALSRLWWIPQGEKPERGGYVNYPFRELLAVLAAESRRARCLVIGEDLGTVPAALRAALNQAGVLSYRPLLFEKDANGEYAPPQAYPRDALVCVSTHDLPTWRGYWEASDLELRRKLGLTVDFQKEMEMRESEKTKLAKAVERSAQSAHAFIARTPAKLAMVQPEDVFELLDQANLPGTVEQHPNWRRKLPLALERWPADARVAALAEAMAERSVAKAATAPSPVTVPVATYRLQFHKDFGFKDAIALVPYLADLGISHLYASPFLKARPGSTHGYDVIDHNAVNPEIGTEAELNRLIGALKKRGMGMVIDLVPNHMGVLHADNAWWLDVLEKGRGSPYARFFDIDWARGKLLLPVLGKHYGEALEELKLERDRKTGKWSVRYFDHRFPLNAKSQAGLKRAPKDTLALHRLLEKQHYRLAYWRVASDEINYRRFFEITDLAGVRMEDRAVFEQTHGLVARLAKAGGIDGVRIDHPDGLADPKQYFERLSELLPRRWIVLEKILADDEKLPQDWPVHGETGYRFVNLLTGLYIDGAAESRFDRIYQRFTGVRRGFDELARESRMLIMATTLAAELFMLSNWLARIAAGNRYTRDYTASGLRKALAEIAAQFPVYRTYVSARGVSDTDRRVIDGAVDAAKRATRIADPSVLDFVRSVLTLEAAPARGQRRREMLNFSMRFQQFTAPVVAKGVEDTAFYRYNRLIALNEVGGHPSHFGVPLKAFHAAAEERVRRWPYTMLGSSTHDTKRSEDVRARLAVLSELASGWRMTLRRWSSMNRVDTPPSRSDEYHFYQALIGIWPGEVSAQLIERLKAYMLKAAREAKERTSWINPDESYEAALQNFVTRSLENKAFLKDLAGTVARVAHLGLLVGLSQALVKVASPGVPDYYQGTELWDFSLVDPDNRRPVDYGVRAKFLKGIDSSVSPSQLLKNLPDGRAKLHVIRKGLELRRKYPVLFHGANYTPLYADAGREENIVAFALSDGARTVIAVAPRLFARLMEAGDDAPLGAKAWGEAKIAVEGSYVNVLTGERHPGGDLRIADLLATFPVALLVSEE
ncbi:MAG TPA: malto-oligosyltrehalose synthase [Burkholderiales bacterium]|nr:malto-oligosyltrehalose synthase [Burkholderiales bacterium]